MSIVAIIGRANVGKSTLFNRLIGRKQAVVAREPGTTRDFLADEASWQGKSFTVVDTAGIDLTGQGLLEKDISLQVREATLAADLIVFLVDAKEGIRAQDKEAAEKIRKLNKPVILAANKAESEKAKDALPEFYQLGLSDPLPVSALQGRGVGDLLDLIVKKLKKIKKPILTKSAISAGSAIAVAILGKPNVGKSTLFNRLLGRKRSIVSELPGTTRDIINEVVSLGDLKVEFIDTAGLRRKGKIETGPELFSSLRSIRAIKEAEICLLLLDAQSEVSQQDKQILNYILKEGKSAILVINKWDLVKKDDPSTSLPSTTLGVNKTTMAAFQWEIKEAFSFALYLPQVYLSALTGQRVDKLVEVLREVKRAREIKLPASKLTSVIREATLQRRVFFKHQPIKIYYAKQIPGKGITIQLTANGAGLPADYERYLKNRIREKLDPLMGTPVFFRFKKPENRK